MDMQFFPDHDELVQSTSGSGIVFLGLGTQFVHGLDERAETEILHFPQVDRERKSSGKFQELSEALRAVDIGRLARESICLFFQTSPQGVFQTANVKFHPGCSCLLQRTLNAVYIQFGPFNGLLELAIQGNFGCRLKGGRNGNAQIIQEMDEGRVVLEYFTVRGRSRCQRIIENVIDNLSLLVAEEGAE